MNYFSFSLYYLHSIFLLFFVLTVILIVRDANPQDGIQFKLLSHDDQGAVAIGELFLDFTNLPTDRPISKWFNLNTSTGESISLQLRVLRSISMV